MDPLLTLANVTEKDREVGQPPNSTLPPPSSLPLAPSSVSNNQMTQRSIKQATKPLTTSAKGSTIAITTTTATPTTQTKDAKPKPNQTDDDSDSLRSKTLSPLQSTSTTTQSNTSSAPAVAKEKKDRKVRKQCETTDDHITTLDLPLELHRNGYKTIRVGAVKQQVVFVWADWKLLVGDKRRSMLGHTKASDNKVRLSRGGRHVYGIDVLLLKEEASAYEKLRNEDEKKRWRPRVDYALQMAKFLGRCTIGKNSVVIDPLLGRGLDVVEESVESSPPSPVTQQAFVVASSQPDSPSFIPPTPQTQTATSSQQSDAGFELTVTQTTTPSTTKSTNDTLSDAHSTTKPSTLPPSSPRPPSPAKASEPTTLPPPEATQPHPSSLQPLVSKPPPTSPALVSQPLPQHSFPTAAAPTSLTTEPIVATTATTTSVTQRTPSSIHQPYQYQYHHEFDDDHYQSHDVQVAQPTPTSSPPQTYSPYPTYAYSHPQGYHSYGYYSPSSYIVPPNRGTKRRNSMMVPYSSPHFEPSDLIYNLSQMTNVVAQITQANAEILAQNKTLLQFLAKKEGIPLTTTPTTTSPTPLASSDAQYQQRSPKRHHFTPSTPPSVATSSI